MTRADITELAYLGNDYITLQLCALCNIRESYYVYIIYIIYTKRYIRDMLNRLHTVSGVQQVLLYALHVVVLTRVAGNTA